MGENGGGAVNYKEILRIQTESGTEEIHYPLFYEDLPEEYRVVAEQTLGETPDRKEKGLRRLRKFMEEENLSTTEDVLITVLRACKYDLKKSESKLKRYLKLRRTIIQKLCKIKEDEIDSILDVAPFGVFPYRDRYGRVILTTEPPKSLDKYPLDVLEPLGYSLVLYLMEFPLTSVCGMSYIAECNGFTLKILYAVLRAYRIYLSSLYDLPIRYGRIDVCNEHPLCRIFYNAIRRFLPQKIAERVHFHGDSYKTLHSIYHPDILPSEFGGNLEPKDDKFYRARLVEFIKKLREEGREENFQI